MPTIRQYFKKSVKNVLLIATAIVSTFLLALFLAWVLPSDGPNLRMLFWFFYAKEIGIGIATLTAAFFLYKAYRVYSAAESFSQELLKMIPTIVFWTAAFLTSSTYLYNFFHQTDCEQYNYTEKLNGGVKEIGGKKYAISICGTGVSNSHFLGEGFDRVQLIVTDEQGSVLARRYYKILLGDTLGHRPLQINQNSISYFDDSNSYAEQGTISIPPTIHDWIGARIPILN